MNSLASEGITYFFMGKFFGARPDNTDLYSKEGYLDFEKTSRSDLFITGMENVKLGLKKGNNIVLMCTEKDPIDCHRAIMVARAFSLEGIDIQHILPDGKLQTQQELDRRLELTFCTVKIGTRHRGHRVLTYFYSIVLFSNF